VYGELERCNDFNKLRTVFDDDMLKYFQKQLEDYLNGSGEHPAIVCWYAGTMSAEDFIVMCS